MKADLDAPCDDDQNTPLMNAIIQGKDRAVIRQLVESGASTTIKHSVTGKTPKDLAKEHDLSDYLRTKADTDAAWGNLVDLVVLFVLLVVWYVNTVTIVVEGIVKKYYNFSVKEGDIPKVRRPCLSNEKFTSRCFRVLRRAFRTKSNPRLLANSRASWTMW